MFFAALISVKLLSRMVRGSILCCKHFSMSGFVIKFCSSNSNNLLMDFRMFGDLQSCIFLHMRPVSQTSVWLSLVSGIFVLFKDNYKIHTTVQATAIVNFKCLPELIQLLKTYLLHVHCTCSL